MIEYEITTTEQRTIIEAEDHYGYQRGLGRLIHRRLSFHVDVLDGPTADRFAKSLASHITYVREAGEQLGVSQEQLIVHDDSKWSDEEFPYYAVKYHGDPHDTRVEQINDNYARAWLHHIHHNPHHWQHWLFSDGFTPKQSSVENGAVAMPDIYALEMVADWMGASMAYTGSFDMMKWLADNKPRIRLHSTTAHYIDGLLDSMGYADIAWKIQWAGQQV